MAQRAHKQRLIESIAPAQPVTSSSSTLNVTPTAVPPEHQWPEIPTGAFSEWVRFARYFNDLEAHIVAGRLSADGVPCVVEPTGPFPGIMTCALWVPKLLAHRARWVLAWAPFTDAELTFLATGELPSASDQP